MRRRQNCQIEQRILTLYSKKQQNSNVQHCNPLIIDIFRWEVMNFIVTSCVTLSGYKFKSAEWKKKVEKRGALHLERLEADTVTHRHTYCIHTWIYCSVPENISYLRSPSWRSRSPKKGTLWEAVNHLCSYALPEHVLFMSGLTLSGSPRMYINTSRPGRTLKYFLDHFSLP